MPSDEMMRRVKKVATLLRQADALLITAGAGMSVDSGLPDFRSSDGFWRAYPPLEALGISFEQMAQPRWFRERPQMAWAFYGHRWRLYHEAVPHAGYALLREWAKGMKAGSFVVTSNVDGHFEKAGFDRDAIAELHGRIDLHQCTEPCSDRLWRATPDGQDLDIDLATLTTRGALPRCPHCQALARPNVLLFVDGSWVDAATREQRARFEQWLANVRDRRLVILELGAGAALPTIRRLGERIAQRSMTQLVRINPDARSSCEELIELPFGALQGLTLIQQALDVQPAASDPLPPSRSQETQEQGPMRSFHLPESPIRLTMPMVIEIDLGTGETGEIDPRQIDKADRSACMDALYSDVEGWIPIPATSFHDPCGYLFQTRVFRSRDEPDETPLGATMAFITAPDRQSVMTVVVGRFGGEADDAWSLVHRVHSGPRVPLDCPRPPWIAYSLDEDAARHAAMLPELRQFGRLLALTWLRAQEFRDYMIREHPEEWRRMGG